MLVKEYLEIMKEKNGNEFTFLIQKAVKDDNTPFYHDEYYQTPISGFYELIDKEFPKKYIVIKADHAPIDITGVWTSDYKKGWLNCCVITTEKDLITRYGEQQGRRMIEFYDKEVREQLK